jgi:hypothetical protein
MNDEWAGPSSHDLAQADDTGLADRLLRAEFTRAPADPATSPGVAHSRREPAEGGTVPLSAPPSRARSHRAGMLAGLGVVGVLLGVLVVVAPGGSAPKPAPTTPTASTTTTTTTKASTTTLHCFLGPIC